MPFRLRIRIGGGDQSFGWEFFPGDTVRGSRGRTRPPFQPPPGRLPPPPTVAPPVPAPPPNTFPLPGATPVPPARPPFGFPTGPAANDPVFGLGRILVRKGLGILGAFGVIADILTLISERGLEQAFEDLILEKVVGARRARIMTERAPREVIVRDPPPDPGTEILFPDAPPPPRIPDPFPIPGRIPVEIPGPIRVEVPIGPSVPDILLPRPQAPTIPAPQPTPTPRTTPAGLPRPNIRAFPLGLPGPGIGPRSVPGPQNFPLQDPLPLTPPQPGVPPLPGIRGFPFAGPTTLAQPQPAPQPAQDRCQVVKRRRRKKGRCREGFFRETPTQTKYVTWRSRKCGVSRKPKDFLRIGI